MCVNTDYQDHKNHIIVCRRHAGTGKDSDSQSDSRICCSMSILSHKHALNACYWRSANWHIMGIDAMAFAQLEQNRKCSHGTSALPCREVR